MIFKNQTVLNDVNVVIGTFRSIGVYDRNNLIVGIDKSKNGDTILGLIASNGRSFKFLVKRYFKGIKHYTEISKTSNLCEKVEYLCSFYERFEKARIKNNAFEYTMHYTLKELSIMRDDVRNRILELPYENVIFVIDDNYVGYIRETVKDWAKLSNITLVGHHQTNNFTHFSTSSQWNNKEVEQILIIKEGFLHRYLVGTSTIYQDLYTFITIADNFANYFRRTYMDKKTPCETYKDLDCKIRLKKKYKRYK